MKKKKAKVLLHGFFGHLIRWLDCCFYLHDHRGFWGTQLDSSQLLAPDTEPDAFLKSEHRNVGPWHLCWAWLPELVANTCDQMHQPWRRSFCPWRRWMLSRLEASKPQRLHVLWRNLQQERRWPVCYKCYWNLFGMLLWLARMSAGPFVCLLRFLHSPSGSILLVCFRPWPHPYGKARFCQSVSADERNWPVWQSVWHWQCDSFSSCHSWNWYDILQGLLFGYLLFWCRRWQRQWVESVHPQQHHEDKAAGSSHRAVSLCQRLVLGWLWEIKIEFTFRVASTCRKEAYGDWSHSQVVWVYL